MERKSNNTILPFALPLFRSVLFLVLTYVTILLFQTDLESIAPYWTTLCVIGNIITIFVLNVSFKKNGTSLKEFIVSEKAKATRKDNVIIPILMIVFGMIGLTLGGFAILGELPSFLIQAGNPVLTIINIVIFPITIILVEIPLYFGYSYQGILEKTNKKWFAFIYVVFFYAFQHLFMPVNFDALIMVFRFVSFLPLMIYLALMVNRNKSIYSMMIGHFILDFMTAMQIAIFMFFPGIMG